MPFSVKSDHADHLLAELRALTGEGITEAVTRSLEHRMIDLRGRTGTSAQNILDHAAEFRATFALPEWQPGMPELSTTHADLLYDEKGLPL